MQKNKFDVVKAVCNSAVRKLAVLGLAVAVSAGSAVSAQTSEGDAEKLLSELCSLERLIETTGDDAKRRELNKLNRCIEKLIEHANMLEQQFEEKNRLAVETLRYADEMNRRIEEKERLAEEKERQAEEKKRQAEEKERLAEEKERLPEGVSKLISITERTIAAFCLEESVKLKNEIKKLKTEEYKLRIEVGKLQTEADKWGQEALILKRKIISLQQQRLDLTSELVGEIPEAQRGQAELMDLAIAEASRQNIPVREFAPRFFANIGLTQEAIQNIMSLFGYDPQQNQQQQYVGGRFNPLNWIFSGGSSN